MIQASPHPLLIAFRNLRRDLIDSVKLWNYYRKTICLFHVKHNVLTRLSKNQIVTKFYKKLSGE